MCFSALCWLFWSCVCGASPDVTWAVCHSIWRVAVAVRKYRLVKSPSRASLPQSHNQDGRKLSKIRGARLAKKSLICLNQ